MTDTILYYITYDYIIALIVVDYFIHFIFFTRLPPIPVAVTE